MDRRACHSLTQAPLTLSLTRNGAAACGVFLLRLRLVAAIRAEKAEDGALELQLLALFNPAEANGVASVDALDAAIVQ